MFSIVSILVSSACWLCGYSVTDINGFRTFKIADARNNYGVAFFQAVDYLKRRDTARADLNRGPVRHAILDDIGDAAGA
jgi:hypothetical protein